MYYLTASTLTALVTISSVIVRNNLCVLNLPSLPEVL